MIKAELSEQVLNRNIESFSARLEALSPVIARLQREVKHENASRPARVLEETVAHLQTTVEELHVAHEELRQQQDALAEARAVIETEHTRYQDLFENAPEAYVVTDMNGIIREANHAAHRLLFNGTRLLVGKALAMRIAADHRKAFRAYLNDLTRAAARQELEVRVQPAGAQPVLTLISATVIRNRSGEPVGLRWLLRDLTLFRKAERLEEERNGIMSENTRLQHVVVESSHRIKNHLQTLAAMVDMRLMEGADFLPNSEFRRFAGQVRAMAAIHDLLAVDVRSGEAGTQLSAQLLLPKVLAMLNEASGAQTIRLRVDDAPLSLKASASLALIVNELVINAMKHSGRTPIEVSFVVENTGAESLAALEVCDNGPGFSEGFNIDTSAHIGLELVEQLVRTDLQGRTRYENRDKGGARVIVSFPVGA